MFERMPGSRRAVAVLARWRVPLGFLFAAAVFWFAEPTSTTLVAGTLIAMPGEALRVWAAGHLTKSSDVTMSGPYRWSAHPLYVGSSIMGAGLAVVSNSLVAFALIGIYLLVTLGAAMSSEEAWLRRTFGDRYDRYRRGDRMDARRRFSVARAIANREQRALVGFALAVLLLALKATYNGLFGGAAGKP